MSPQVQDTIRRMRQEDLTIGVSFVCLALLMGIMLFLDLDPAMAASAIPGYEATTACPRLPGTALG